MARFDGKTVLVTGGASGMGKATAIRFGEEGADVVIGDIDVDGAKETAESIVKAGGVATAIQYDAMEEDSCIELVQSAVRVHGQLDVVVNVAGIASFYRLDETTAEIFNRFITVNLTSTLVICRESIPELKRSGGNIINFASINAFLPVACHAAYDASKAGVLAITKGIAQELVKDGVRCNAICPGGFDTPMNVNKRMPDDMDLRKVSKLSSPLIPFGRPEQIAGVVAFLASDDASYVNGEHITVDGGVTAAL